MNIAFVNQPWEPVTGPEPQAGSISIWTWEVARRLAGRHHVVVYDGRPQWSAPRQTAAQNVEYRFIWTGLDRRFTRLRSRHPRLSRMLGFEHSDLTRQDAAQPWFYAAYARQVANAIRRERFDVVHVHQSYQFASAIRRANPHTRVVLHMNCEWLSQFDRSLIEPRLQDPDVILGCSDHITNLIRNRFPQFAAKCWTVPNGVDVGRFAPPRQGSTRREARRLSFIGRVSPEKGVHDLLEAFAIVHRSRPDVALHLVGQVMSLPRDWIIGISNDPLVTALDKYYQGDYRTHLDHIITTNGLTSAVSFDGPVPNSDLPASYHEADILINPSLSESFGMTVVEAMASATPVIVTRTGGMAETVVHHETGLVAPPANPSALAAAILALLQNDSLRMAMGSAGRKRTVALYSWDSVAASWLERCGIEPSPVSSIHPSASSSHPSSQEAGSNSASANSHDGSHSSLC